MSSGGGGAEYEPETIIRYAPYIEEKHKSFLSAVAAHKTQKLNNSPFGSFTDIELESGFFGVGESILSSAALYDVFGKHMAALDIEELWDTAFDSSLTASAIEELSSAEAALLDNVIDSETKPEFLIAMMNANAVTSSTFVIGNANIEKNRAKAISAFNNNLVYTMVSDAQARWNKSLDWNKSIAELNARLHQMYYERKIEVDNFNTKMAIEDALWPFTVLEWERSALGALQGAASASSSMDVDEPSGFEKGLSGALSGASLGTAILPGWGTAIGAVIGIAASLF
jgi:hypothetical protein